MGLFATRTPHRPNPIGLSVVKIESVGADFVIVSGIDFIEGTPVLDVKPYVPEVEAIANATNGWTEGIQAPDFEFLWPDSILELVEAWQARSGRTALRELIEETLRLDPRPKVYKGYEGEQSPYRQVHAVRLFEGDVHFSFPTPQKIKIEDIRF